ncbi:FxLD family lanthipeptide [Streptomyces sp. SDT5-1]|uniref:FxLD family lanthipeptide n=1 Tax=Streptomyces sp. SDT5-1 TaxID=3406418 RepID=UPI003FD45355
MSPITQDKPRPTAATDVQADQEWDLDLVFTRSPVAIPAACDTSDGCKASCASSCASS